MCYGTILLEEFSIVIGERAMLVYSSIVIACLCHTVDQHSIMFYKRVLQSSNIILFALLRFKKSDMHALLTKYGIPSLSLPAHVLRNYIRNSYVTKIDET